MFPIGLVIIRVPLMVIAVPSILRRQM